MDGCPPKEVDDNDDDDDGFPPKAFRPSPPHAYDDDNDDDEDGRPPPRTARTPGGPRELAAERGRAWAPQAPTCPAAAAARALAGDARRRSAACAL